MIRNLFFCTIFLLLAGCSSLNRSSSERDAQPLPTSAKELELELSKAKNLLGKNPSLALEKLQSIAAKHSNTSAGLEAHKLLGDYFLKTQNNPGALKHYLIILQNSYFEPYEITVCKNTANIYKEINQPQKSLEILNKTLSFTSLSSDERLQLLFLRLEIQKSYQDVYGQLETLGTMYTLASKPSTKESLRARANSLTDFFARPQDIEAVLSNSRLELVHPALHFRLGNLAFEKSDFSTARSHLNDVLSLDPNGEYADTAREILEQMDARLSVQSKTVGVILPLSGKYADIGRSVLNSLQIGLGIYDDNSNIRLAIIDSEGRSLDSRKAVEKLVIEDRVIAIIGSLQSKSAAAVAAKSQSLGVPTIVLSQKSGITDIGPYVFRNALTSEMQVEHLVKVAREQLGLTRFGVLYPEDAYGIEYANLFWSAVEKSGGEVRAAQSYDPKETDFRTPIQRLVGTYYTEDRSTEYKQRLAEWEQKNKKKSVRDDNSQEILPPLVDFEALFIPDNTKSLGQISAMLSVSDVKGITLLGTNLWNTSGLIERSGHFKPVFVDSFLKNDPQFLNSKTVKEFLEKTGKTPSSFDLQAYDTAVVLKEALAQASSRNALQEELSKISTNGSISSIQMLPSRDLSRPIVTLTINKDGQIVLLQ